MKRSANTAGFTLIEVLLAFLLFVTIFSVFAQTKGGSEQSVRQNLRRDVAVRLLQTKMTETEIKIQNIIDKNGVPTSYNEESGTFEDPYIDYQWTYKFSQPSIKFTAETLIKFLTNMGMDKDEAMAQVESQKLVMTNLNKNIEANFGELLVEVKWDYLGQQKMSLLTHLVPKKAKVTLTTTAESD